MTTNSYGLEPLKATQLSARPSSMQAPFFSLNTASARPNSLLPPTSMTGSLSSSPPATPAFVSSQPLQQSQATQMDRAASLSSVRTSAAVGGLYQQPHQSYSATTSFAAQQPDQGFQSVAEQSAPSSLAPSSLAPSQQQDDTQVMTKLQQLMNQMGNFMKSVDARLTTLEKMTQQLISNQTEQAKTVDLRFQEIAQLIQQKSSVIQIPSHQQPLPPTGHQQPSIPSGGYGYPTLPQMPTNPTPIPTSDRDYELARQLQEQFDRENSQISQSQQQPQQPQQLPHSPYAHPMNLTGLQLQQMQASQPPLQQKTNVDPKQPSTCPICGVTMGLIDMEAHVNQHFDEAEGIVADTLDKKNAKKNTSFWDKLWGGDDPEPQQAPMPQATPQQQQQPARPGYPQMVMYPAGMLAGQPTVPGGAMYPSYAYPGQPQQPSYQNPGYLQR